jgi:hypothetical protein
VASRTQRRRGAPSRRVSPGKINRRRERCLAETDAYGIENRIENRIADSRRDGCDGALTCAWRRHFERVEPRGNDFEQGIAEMKNRIGPPVERGERARSRATLLAHEGRGSCPAGHLRPSDS